MDTARVKPGDVLGGKYKVERLLGAGGMGVVVAARHVDLGQRVALKFMLKEAMSDSSHAERFLREAKSAVQLRSVHTARVLDVGRFKNGEPFMVMEYLEGRDLDAELRARGPLPPRVAVDYILQASEALAEAHGLGMVHRDVKPKNLFLTSTIDGRPLVKVLDFGLAKTLGPHGDVSLTATNTVFGSPQYMSPEQMRSSKDVDFRSDIWSIGVCLYELLTGRVPFDAQNVAEICAMVLKDPVPPPSQIAPVPFDLERVVLKCLEKDVNQRFQSIADLAFALQAYAADEGSARRILHVMRSAKTLDHGATIPNGEAIEAGARTMSAWDSGQPTTKRTTQLLSRPQLIAAFIAVALMGVVGAGAITVAIKKRTASVAITETAPEAAPPQSAPPAPVESIAHEPASPIETPAPTASVAGAAASATPTPTAATAPRPKPLHVGPSVPAKATAAPSSTPAPKPSSTAKNRPGSGADYM